MFMNMFHAYIVCESLHLINEYAVLTIHVHTIQKVYKSLLIFKGNFFINRLYIYQMNVYCDIRWIRLFFFKSSVFLI